MIKHNCVISVDGFSLKTQQGVVKLADRIEENIMLQAFLRSVDLGASRYNLVDGMVDRYQDETGIDTGSCVNQVYDGTNHLYSPSGAYNNMTLQSIAFVAASTPQDARLVIFEEDVSSITLNTDIKGWISRDGGTTWSQVTLANEGNYQSPRRVLAGIVDLVPQPVQSVYNVKYKVTTHNNKNLKLYGASLSW